MKSFVIFGDIEFLNDEENTAIVHKVRYAGFYDDDEVWGMAEKNCGDWIAPHYYQGRIKFMQYQEEKAYE